MDVSEHPRRAWTAWWYWSILLVGAVVNDCAIGSVGGGIGRLLGLMISVLEVGLIAWLMRRTGRYQRRWVVLAAVVLVVLMALPLLFLFAAFALSPPDPS